MIRRGLTLLLACLCLSLLGGALPFQAMAQSPISVETSAENEFPNGLRFHLQASTTAGDITEARLSFKPTGGRSRGSAPLRFDRAPTIEGEHQVDRAGTTLAPGVVMEYTWLIKDSAGNELTTEPQTISYLPTGFSWQEATRGNVTFVWYDGSRAWGESVAEYSLQALEKVEQDLGASVQDQQLRIVAFSTGEDFHEAMPYLQEWVGGITRADAGMTIQIISPEESGQEWMRTVVAHELGHLVFDAATPAMLAPLPNWMSEGLAMYNEPGDHSNDRARVEEAASEGRLYRLSELRSESFGDHSAVSLGYAMGWSIVDYLVSDCGQDGLRSFISELNSGKTLDDALTAACGYNEQGLYNRWYTELTGETPPNSTEDPLQPIPQPGDRPNQAEPVSTPAQSGTVERESAPAADPIADFFGPVLILFGCGMAFVAFVALGGILFALSRTQKV